jgi:hypothetical protein
MGKTGFSILMLALMFCQAQISFAAGNTFYVDQNNIECSDADGAPGSEAVPFCTISKANSVHSGGDVVLIKPGIYREMIFPKSGTADHYTVFAGLGTRSDIIVTGSELIGKSRWHLYRDNIYYADLPDTQKRCEAYDVSLGSKCSWDSNNKLYFCTNNSSDCWEDGGKWYIRADLDDTYGNHFVATKNQDNIDEKGKYWIDLAARRVYLRTFDDLPPTTNHFIECSARTVLPLMSGGGSDSDGFEPYSVYWPQGYTIPSYYRIENLTIMHSYRNGLVMAGSTDFVEVIGNEFMYNSGGSSCAANPAAIIKHKRCGPANPPDCPLAQGINIRNNVIRDQGSDLGPTGFSSSSGGQGIEYYHVSDSIAEKNDISNINIGIYVKSGNSKIKVKNNRIHDFGTAVYMQLYISDSSIYGNLIYDSRPGQDAISLHHVTNIKVFNNTVYNVGRALVLTRDQIDQTSYKNNIVMDADEEFTVVDSFGPAEIHDSDYNLFYGPFSTRCEDITGAWECISGDFETWQTSTGNDWNSDIGDPLFADIDAHDFHIGTGSPAINEGIRIDGLHCEQSYEANPDQVGCRHWTEPSPDRGAYEFGLPDGINDVNDEYDPTDITPPPDDGGTPGDGNTNPNILVSGGCSIGLGKTPSSALSLITLFALTLLGSLVILRRKWK